MWSDQVLSGPARERSSSMPCRKDVSHFTKLFIVAAGGALYVSRSGRHCTASLTRLVVRRDSVVKCVALLLPRSSGAEFDL